MQDFSKSIRIGTIPYDSTRAMSVFCDIKFKAGKLSITGVEGPKANGDCLGSCGQIDMHLRERGGLDGYIPADGWTLEMVNQLLQIWRDHHLNDMKPYDAEMLAAGWPDKAKIELIGYRFTINSETINQQRSIKDAAQAKLNAGESARYSAADLAIVKMPYDMTIWQYPDAPAPACPDGYKAGDYRGEKQTERKALGWLRPEEHPDGMLGRKLRADVPAYGSRWFKHDIPESVLQWLADLPDADKPNPWNARR